MINSSNRNCNEIRWKSSFYAMFFQNRISNLVLNFYHIYQRINKISDLFHNHLLWQLCILDHSALQVTLLLNISLATFTPKAGVTSNSISQKALSSLWGSFILHLIHNTWKHSYSSIVGSLYRFLIKTTLRGFGPVQILIIYPRFLRAAAIWLPHSVGSITFTRTEFLSSASKSALTSSKIVNGTFTRQLFWNYPLTKKFNQYYPCQTHLNINLIGS